MFRLDSARMAALTGVAFTVLLFFGVASINVPHNASDQELIEWWSKSSNQTSSIASMYLVTASSITFAIFVTHLRSRLAQGTTGAANAMYGVGLAFVAMAMASAVARGVVGHAIKVDDEVMPGVDLLRYLPQLSYGFMSAGLICAGVTALFASVAIWQTRELGVWMVWVSAVAGVLLIVVTPVAGPLTLPVLWLWALSASVAVWRSSAPDASRAGLAMPSRA